ncbi:MAG TPA: hypothetical protein V6D15_12355 [Oculatellaceae cyanobacterium]|jgi:tetratricopeptide (TPR) repeat protein
MFNYIQEVKMRKLFCLKNLIYCTGVISVWGVISLPINAEALPTKSQVDSETTLLLQRGKNEFDAENYQSALEKFDRVVEKQPQLAVGYYYRGLVYAQYVGGKPLTRGGIVPGCDRNPSNTSIIVCDVNKALRWVADNRSQAIADFNQAIKINFNYAQAYHQRALVQTEEPQKIADLKSAIALYHSQGIDELKQANYSLAASNFQQVQKLETSVYALTNLSIVQNQDSITKLGSSLIREKEKSADKYFAEANSLLSRGNTPAALNKFKMAAILFKDTGNSQKAERVEQIIKQIEKKSF